MVGNNDTCTYSNAYKWIVEVSHSSIVSIIIAILTFSSNVLTILVLSRIKQRTSTENLLFAIATTDLLLPLVHSTRYLLVFFHKTNDELLMFLSWHFFVWQYFYLISILFTLLLASRRYIAISYPHLYRIICNRKNTKKAILATFIISAALILPLPIFVPNYESSFGEVQRRCMDIVPKEVVYYSIIMTKVYLSGNFIVTIIYWLYILFFQVVSPCILALLSFRFVRALRNRFVYSTRNPNIKKITEANQKTKLILIVSLVILVRDLPLGLMATFYIFVLPSPVYLATIRLVTKELTIVMSATNFMVLYCTNQKFKEAVPRLRSLFSGQPKQEDNVLSETSSRRKSYAHETKL